MLVALSGGADSVLLLKLFHQLSKDSSVQVAACHVNHNIRGELAKIDARFSEELCTSLQVSFLLKSVHVPQYAQEKGLSTEDAARTLRYQALEEAAIECGANVIATAHHADDLAETMLFRLFKGTGVSGLASIPIQRPSGKTGVTIIRPLLFTAKTEILHYLESIHQSFVNDETNTSTQYERNFIRHSIIPLIEKRYPAFRDKMADHYRIALDEEAHWAAHIMQLEPLVCKKPGYMTLSKKELANINDLSLQRRLIRHIILKMLGSCYYPPLAAINRIIQSLDEIEGNKILFKNPMLEVDSTYREICFRIPPKSFPNSLKYVTLSTGTLTHWDSYSIGYESFDPSYAAEEKAPQESTATGCFFNTTNITEILVRQRQNGDRISIGNGKTKKIKDFFIDSKFTLIQRENSVVFDSQGRGIIAVFIPDFGFRVSADFYWIKDAGQTLGTITLSMKELL